jgi:hypothetical protein
MEQPDWLLADLLAISAVSERVREQLPKDDHG